jgi:hypothetical protein
MVTMILVLCLAAEGFMLTCLFHFGQELRQESRRRSAAGLWIASSNVVPFQSTGHTRIVVCCEGEGKSKGTTKEHYDVAA